MVWKVQNVKAKGDGALCGGAAGNSRFSIWGGNHR